MKNLNKRWSFQKDKQFQHTVTIHIYDYTQSLSLFCSLADKCNDYYKLTHFKSINVLGEQ